MFSGELAPAYRRPSDGSMNIRDEPLRLRISVPICAFRPHASREYQDTYPVPTPASVYGMMLSFVGVPREEKAKHRGCQLVIAVEHLPERSRVFRKFRRGKTLQSLRPDYQDLLLDVCVWVWLRQANDTAEEPLVRRVFTALRNPSSIVRAGGLSLGESSYLVNDLSHRCVPPAELTFLRPHVQGFYALPVWVDHLDASKTRVLRCSLERLASDQVDQCWIEV